MTVFVSGKQKRINRPLQIDGMAVVSPEKAVNMSELDAIRRAVAAQIVLLQQVLKQPRFQSTDQEGETCAIAWNFILAHTLVGDVGLSGKVDHNYLFSSVDQWLQVEPHILSVDVVDDGIVDFKNFSEIVIRVVRNRDLVSSTLIHDFS